MPGPVRNILLTTEVKTAGRRCKCSHDKRHEILKGEARVVINNAGAVGDKGYCASCGRAMVTAAKHQLAELETALGMTPTSSGANVSEDALSGSRGSGR